MTFIICDYVFGIHTGSSPSSTAYLQVGEAPNADDVPGICEAVVRAAMGDPAEGCLGSRACGLRVLCILRFQWVLGKCGVVGVGDFRVGRISDRLLWTSCSAGS